MPGTELVRLIEPPEWGRKDRKWGMFVSDDWRGLLPSECGRRCSICGLPAWLVRLEDIVPFRGTAYTRRSFRCPDHVYSTKPIELTVLVARPLPEGT